MHTKINKYINKYIIYTYIYIYIYIYTYTYIHACAASLMCAPVSCKHVCACSHIDRSCEHAESCEYTTLEVACNNLDMLLLTSFL